MTIDLQGLVAALAVITFLATTATVVAFGFQRGRVNRLEASNTDLRAEVADEKRRREQSDRDLAAAKAKTLEQHDELVDLRSKVTTMTEIVHGVTGPIANLVAVVDRTNQLVAAHNDRAMKGLGEVHGLQLEALGLLGDKRVRPAMDTGSGDGDDAPRA